MVASEVFEPGKPLTTEKAVGKGGYDPDFFNQLMLIEDRHFWFRARNRLIFGIANKISSSIKPCDWVLEIGCGTGNVLRVLEKAFPDSKLVGLELWREGLQHSRTRSSALLVAADISQSPLGKKFDVIGMFDVLEHVAKDQGALRSIYSSLRPGGTLLLTVPAHQSLWSYFDEAACHCRRYSAAGLREELEDAGFEVRFLSQFMATLFPIVWAFRKLNGIRGSARSTQKLSDEEFRIVPIVNPVLAFLLHLEAIWVSRGHSLPIGTSLVVIAQKMA
jgi:SAM-dependent methyltransferase